jgi:hypothetical protein
MDTQHSDDLPTEDELKTFEDLALRARDGQTLLQNSNLMRLVRAARRAQSPHKGMAALGDGTYLAYRDDIHGLEDWECRGGPQFPLGVVRAFRCRQP